MTQFLKGVREFLTPVLSDSAFLSDGVLTPEEFVLAGDHLVSKNPNWRWEGGESSKHKSYLPPEKQFLVARRFRCPQRVSDLAGQIGDEDLMVWLNELEGEEGEGECGGGERKEEDGWLMPQLTMADNKDDFEMDSKEEEGEEEEEEGEEEGEGEKKDEEQEEQEEPQQQQEEDSDDDSFVDIDEFGADGLEEDPQVVSSSSSSSSSSLRLYDLHITYDKYYRTPKVFFTGVLSSSSSSRPLSAEEMFEDVMQDYSNKTVTIEPHPHLSSSSSSSGSNNLFAAIHPCKHASVMKKIVQNVMVAGEGEEGKTQPPDVRLYLFFFLKFIQSVIPTIEYDYTIGVNTHLN